MTITAKVIAHSRVEGASDLITLECRYPRMIHSEFMTHRVFSRNASSSRAIPIEKMIRDVLNDPAMPAAWGSNKPGMQAGDEIDTLVEIPHIMLEDNGTSRGDAYLGTSTAADAWERARDIVVEFAKGFAAAGYHKQIVNRLLEPFGHITVVVTATEWDNFFDLRCHPDADPTMRALAEAMRDAIAGSTPEQGHPAPWHLPYVRPEDWNDIPNVMSGDETFQHLAMISAARCARVSYLTHSGERPNIAEDLALAEKLLVSKHASPFEHMARADDLCANGEPAHPWLSGNFAPGWQQYRKMIGL